jgi:hypothetical protein
MSFKKPLIEILAAIGLIILPVVMTASAAESTLFSDMDKPLFSDPLFSTDDVGAELNADVRPKAAPADPRTSVDRKIQLSQIDQEMRQQIRRVAGYLQNYQIRNFRFPGFQNDEMYAAQVQLNELVPNNPYAYGPTEVAGFAGMPSQYNQNGSPQAGSPVWGDDFNDHLQAQANARILLSIDYNLTPVQIEEWAKHPPDYWQAAPGTITAVGNNQGLLYVWGAGADGKPIMNPMNGHAFVVSGSSNKTVNDQAAPNEV